MRRLAIFEFEDQPWCPPAVRRAVTGYLRLVSRLTRQVRPVVPAVADLLARSGQAGIVDLCSGSGGVAADLSAALAASGVEAHVLLTDLFPDVESFDELARASGGRVAFRGEPLDATRVPPEMVGVRTMFNAFHHFEPDEAERILRDAAEAGRPIAIVEFVERSAFTLLGVLLSPLWMVLLAPFARPLRPGSLAVTCLLPIAPLVALWDGLASWLRVYSPDELRAMTRRIDVPGYAWDVGHWRVGPTRVTYLVGCPR